MRDSKARYKWQRLPENEETHKKIDVDCRICGQPITLDDEYEVVKRGKTSTFYHTHCLKKEAQNNG